MEQIGRLAMREQGERWVAYYARNDSMDDAIELGSIAMSFVGRPDRKNQFMDLMRECFADAVQREIGIRPEWGGPVDAPEHERGNPDGL